MAVAYRRAWRGKGHHEVRRFSSVKSVLDCPGGTDTLETVVVGEEYA